MVVVMKVSATTEDVEAVAQKVREAGGEAHISQGRFKTIIGLVGDTERFMELPLSTLPGVDSVIRIGKPYKLVARETHPASTDVRVGPATVSRRTFTLIAGPCAVENHDQALEAARASKAAGATILRGGAYKPRTSPYTFQGLGVKGLEILAECRKQTGLPVLTEVLDPRDVETVAGRADALQVGTRNMQNFALLREVGLSHMPVLLKRGFSSTVEEWLMAAEYIAREGTLDIILCERGIRTFEPWTRNTLDLGGMILAQNESHLPVIVDPSHAMGKRELVEPLACAAVAAGADGVMVDVHGHPEVALVDGAQALEPDDLMRLGAKLAALSHTVGCEFAGSVAS